MLFTLESVMFGEGLTWEESVPAQVGTMMKIQSANLAVHGYRIDQAYLCLQTELPRFRQPVAAVTLFMTALFGRNLDDDRPHLAPGLAWRPAEQHARLASLAKLLVPYRRIETVERNHSVTREVLRATATLASARGAAALASCRSSEWKRLATPVGPSSNATAAARIATAVASRLRERQLLKRDP